jgi:hypothetical protein
MVLLSEIARQRPTGVRIMRARTSEGVRWLSLKIRFIAAPGHALFNVDADVQDHATCNGALAQKGGSEQLSSSPLPRKCHRTTFRVFAASEPPTPGDAL